FLANRERKRSVTWTYIAAHSNDSTPRSKGRTMPVGAGPPGSQPGAPLRLRGDRCPQTEARREMFPMSADKSRSARRKPFIPAAALNDPPVVKEALAKAEENAASARSAETPQEREFRERMRRTWLGIADGWRVILEYDKV